MKDFIKKHPKIYLPYVKDKFGVSDEELTQVICDMWDGFENPVIMENMLVKNNNTECNYYEICNSKYERGKYIHKDKIWEHCYYNSGSDRHISVFRHDNAWVNNIRRSGSVSCRNTYVSADWIYLELDRPTFEQAERDALVIYKNFPYKEQMLLWFSGNKSIHIAVHASLFGYPTGKQENVCGLGKLFYNLAHKIAGDVRHENGVVDPWLLSEPEILEEYFKTTGIAHNKADISKLKQELENIDPNLFRVNSLIRQPWSIHEKGKNEKSLMDMKTHTYKEKEKFDIKENKPYLLHWIAECYEERYKTQPIIQIDVDDSVINNVFKVIDGFDPSLADSNGWINNMYSPFYEDENPSVAVNIKTGVYKDHGEPTHTFGIVEFYSKLHNIDYEKAREKIKGR